MFEWLKKKKKEIPDISYEQILERVENDKKLGRTSAFFFDVEVSDETIQKLNENGITLRNSHEVHGFEIFW